MATVDLLLPTYRWGPYVRGYISYLAALVNDETHDLCLHIGDNSCNPAKHEFLRELESDRIKLHLHSVNIGVHPNATILFSHSTGEFVQSLSDDDWIHPSCFDHAAFLERNPDCSSCAGFFAGIPPTTGDVLASFDQRFMLPDPVERSLDYTRYVLWETGVNWLALAVHRRSIMSVYVNYTLRHPFQFYFRDQLLSQIALLRGPVKGVREGFMYYHNRTPEELSTHIDNFCKSLEGMGLAAWLFHYYDYLLACEYAMLYLYRGLPDSSFTNRIEDADRVFAMIFDRFYSNYGQKPEIYEQHFKQAGIQNAMHSVLNSPSAIVGLRSMVNILAAINPDAGQRYADFLQKESVVDIMT